MSKNKRKWRNLTHLAGMCLLVTAVLSGCSVAGTNQEAAPDRKDGKVKVAATLFPYYDFARQVGGDYVDVSLIVPAGMDTHSFEPTASDLIRMGNADLLLYNGGENEQWVGQVIEAATDQKLLADEMVQHVKLLTEEHVEGMQEEKGEAHDHDEDDAEHEEHEVEHEEDEADHEEHGQEETHSVHEIDEHVWTSPLNAVKIVEQIKEELCEIDSENASDYEENAEAYVAQLKELDQEFQDVVDHSKRKLMIFGDRFPFRYFAEAYGLDYYAAFSGCASDTEPSAATMAFLINKVQDENIKTVLKMELSNENIAKAIAEATNADVKEFYSCHNLTAEQFADGETYLSLMEKNVETLREVLN